MESNCPPKCPRFLPATAMAPMPKSALFSPFTLRSVTFPNRIMVSPMGQCSAVDGCATDWHFMHLGSLAVSGAGAIGVEATAVTANGRNTPYDLGLWNEAQVEALKPALAFCRRNSVGRIGLQLWHVGRKGSVLPAWERHRPITPAEGDAFFTSAIRASRASGRRRTARKLRTSLRSSARRCSAARRGRSCATSARLTSRISSSRFIRLLPAIRQNYTPFSIRS